MTYSPLVAITMGDAAGIGAEIIMKSLGHAEVYARCRPLVIGEAERLRAAGRIVGSSLAVRVVPPAEIETTVFENGVVNCIDLGLIPADLPWGRLSPIAGAAAFRYVETATKLAMAGRIDAICTAPLNKEALHAGGYLYPGHTEMLAALTGVDEVSMMLTAPNLRVIHVTTHIGLIDAIARIEPGLVERTIARGYSVLEGAGCQAPPDRRLWNQSARRRKWFVWPRRGSREDRARHRRMSCQRMGCRGPATCRYFILPGQSRRFRHGRCHVSRPGTRSDQSPGHRGRS